jgi:hypothetical protein
MSKSKPTSQAVHCVPHLERLRIKVIAARVVSGTPLCPNCFRGSALRRAEELGGRRAAFQSEARTKRIRPTGGAK